ncbi:MAG: ArsA family ATPase [Solirubrobacteraceae bacterium]|jgi:anion-transporting  ArsA/GET3 family ATPase
MAQSPTTSPAERRLVFVLGKGGVGRTTIAAALGLLDASRGARTIVAEVSARGELPELFGASATAGESEVAPNLWTLQIDTSRALDEYLHEHMPLRMLADMVGATRLVGYLAAATPGLRELLNAGKLWELAQPERRIADARPYDRVIVDAPASGHALGLLTAPGAFARTAQGGPIARQGGRIDEMLHDRSRTALIAVTRPLDAAISELLELRRALRDSAGLELDLVAVNATPPPGLARADIAQLEGVLSANGGLAPNARAAVGRALAEERARKTAAQQLERLGHELNGVPLIELPTLYSAQIGTTELATLTGLLAELL